MHTHGPGAVLIYGHDSLLLQTRRRILEQAGYTVWTTGSLDQVEILLAREAIGVFIVCQTISDEEGEAAIRLAHQSRPETKTLVMSLTKQRLLNTARETPFHVSAGPRTLLKTVRRLVGEPGAPPPQGE